MARTDTKPADPPAGVDETPPDGDPGSDTDVDGGPESPESSFTPFQDKMAELRKELEDEQAAGLEGEGAGEGDDPEPEGGAEGDDPDGEEELPPAAEGEGEAGEEEEEVEGDGEEGEDDDVVFVALPGRREGEEFELPLDVEFLEAAGLDPADTVERLNQLRNNGMRRADYEEAMQEVQAGRSELDGIYEELQADPTGFILETVDPGIQANLAEHLVLSLDDEVFGKLIRKIDDWSRRPETREAARAKAEVERLRGEKQRKAKRTSAQQTNTAARAIGSAVKDLIPDGMDDRRANRFFKLAIDEIRAHVKNEKLTTLDPAQVPELLGTTGVLEDFGISVEAGTDGGDAGTQDPPQESASKNGRTGPKAKASKGPKSSSRSKAKGSDVRERLKRRKAAATTPGGAGSAAPEGFKKVPGETHAERRNRLARALGLPEKDMGD